MALKIWKIMTSEVESVWKDMVIISFEGLSSLWVANTEENLEKLQSG
jgi:hypothetical protein